jgi:L-iditol 2-dehydrogenase
VLTAAVATATGANVLVSGLSKDGLARFPILEGMGIETVDVEREDLDDRAAALTDGVGFDTVFDTTGHESGVEIAVEQVRKGGEVVSVGLPSNPSEVFMTPVVRGEIDLNTSYGSTWTNFEQALRLMENGAIEADRIVDTSYSVEDPTAAFEAFLGSETLKPVFTFDD